jgi:polyisoprenyl-phosphate glycosyltransferase
MIPIRSAGRGLTLVCPVLNEEEVIDLFLTTIAPHIAEAKALMGQGAWHEVIFVDDGSSDATPAIIAAAAQANPSIRLLRLSRNFGKEAALAAGLSHSSGDAVIPIDVDLQDPPELIVRMVAAWLGGAKIVNAHRAERDTDGRLKRWTAGLFYNSFNRIAQRPIPPNVGDFRLLDREVVDVLNQFTERNRFMKAIFSWVGFQQETIHYRRAERAAGTTKFRYWRLWNFALDGITGSSTVPLRMWTYVGAVMASFAILYALYIVAKTMFTGADVPGYASLMVVMLGMGAFNLISLGILGEYVGRISEEVRGRPLYIVHEKIGFHGPYRHEQAA